ncbi:MAG: hypothetical protein ETSY1_20935 [Candidatus Entotheonella factor]|uniref:EF-hand domain-containing protein n=1 Tax=Entotheonella factor TaxID=1429438 RepID=W4LKN3_ENTF1|nr:MAG: hypothetical protein ETSY1_20935 [Candidatus Entotheonella factor]
MSDRQLELANERLAARDQNGDGKVSLEELIDFYVNDEQLQSYFSKSDLEEMAKETFQKLDTDKNGFITLSELI